jgi:hypothetical protein
MMLVAKALDEETIYRTAAAFEGGGLEEARRIVICRSLRIGRRDDCSRRILLVAARPGEGRLSLSESGCSVSTTGTGFRAPQQLFERRVLSAELD